MNGVGLGRFNDTYLGILHDALGCHIENWGLIASGSRHMPHRILRHYAYVTGGRLGRWLSICWTTTEVQSSLRILHDGWPGEWEPFFTPMVEVGLPAIGPMHGTG